MGETTINPEEFKRTLKVTLDNGFRYHPGRGIFPERDEIKPLMVTDPTHLAIIDPKTGIPLLNYSQPTQERIDQLLKLRDVWDANNISYLESVPRERAAETMRNYAIRHLSLSNRLRISSGKTGSG